VVSQAKKASLNYAFGAVAQNVVLQVNGSNGSEAFNFAAGSSISEIAKAVNLVSDATGVGNNPHAVSEMPGPNFGRRYDFPFRVVPEGLQVAENNTEPSRSDDFGVLHEHESR
jgi:hypothetical protein